MTQTRRMTALPSVAPEPWSSVLVAVAFGAFLLVSAALTVIDLRTHRLPNRLVLPSYAVALALFTSASAVDAEWRPLLRAGLGMALAFGFYLVLRLMSLGGMGGGDVKLAGLIGLHLGWVGATPLVLGVLAGFVLGGLFGVVLLIARLAHRRTAIAFGPWMIAGAWLGLALGDGTVFVA